MSDTDDKVRNHALCIRCGSASRHRHVAISILKAFKDKDIQKLGDFRKNKDLKVFIANSKGPIVKKTGAGDNIITSEYFDDCKPGEYKDGVMCQDFEALTFEDESIDLIVSEDVFEHVKDYKKGFKEVARVLKQGGYHIFSVPFYFHKRTQHLFEWKDGKYVPCVFPIEYHGDRVRGQIPAYQRFGYDLFDVLSKQGFEVDLKISKFWEYARYGTFDSYTFVTRKREV